MTYSVTVKGQVTIPSQVRHALGIAPGDKVDFRLHGGEARLRPARDQNDITRLFGILKSRRGVSLAEMKTAPAAAAAARHAKLRRR